MADQSTVEEQMAALAAVPGRIIAAWAKNDADAFADVFTEDGSLILPGVYLSSREEIRAFMAAAYAGPFAGTQVYGVPLQVRKIADDAALVITSGGVIDAGESEVRPEKSIRATWVLAKRDGEWLITAYQNTTQTAPTA